MKANSNCSLPLVLPAVRKQQSSYTKAICAEKAYISKQFQQISLNAETQNNRGYINMKIFRNKKTVIGIAAVLMSLVFAISGTFAWFTARNEAINHMETERFTNGDVKIIETWDPEDGINWVPGTTINKDAGAINTGNADAIVRMSFEEVLSKLLTGVAVNLTTGWSDGQKWIDASSNSYDVIAQTANIAAYTGWTTLAAGDTNFTNIVDTENALTTTGLTIVYQKNTVAAPSGGTKTTYNFAAYYSLGNGKYQKVDLPQAKVASGVLTIGALQYQALAVAPTATIDWLAAATNRPASDITVPAAGALAGKLSTWALTDATNKYINLIFANANVSTSATPTAADANKWWYNAADGWFYYIGKLASGATTSNLLDAMYLAEDISADYNGISFDLKVKMEAIQNVKEAITATTGWGKNATAADTIALIAALTAVSAF
jgi:hypothetical protein